MIMKSATIGNVKSKSLEGISSLRKKEVLKNSHQKGPLKLGQKPIKCYRCDGWGHGWSEFPTPENLNWRELVGTIVFSTPGSPGSKLTPIPNQNQ